MRTILKLLERPRRRHGERVFRDWITMVACALSYGTREEEYLAVVKKYEKDEMQAFCDAMALLVEEVEAQRYTDILGPIHMETGSQWEKQRGGEFYTPQNVAVMMAKMTCHDLPDKPVLTGQEPACGAGVMILAASQEVRSQGKEIYFEAWDVSQLAADMCLIQTTLNDIPCRVIHGNTLTMKPMHVYNNFPLILRGGWPRERDQEPEPEAVLAEVIDVPAQLVGQMELFDFNIRKEA